MDAKFEELIRHFNKLKESRNRSVSNHDRSQMDDTKSVKSSRSKKSKSKSKHKVYNDELKLKISEQKKIKENELKEALKRKKESQQKLRMKK